MFVSGLVLHHTSWCACVCLQGGLVPFHAVSARLCVALCRGALRVCAEEGIVLSAAAASCFMQIRQLASLAGLAWGIWCGILAGFFLLYQYLVHAER